MKKFEQLPDKVQFMLLVVKLLIAVYAILMVENVAVLYQGF